MGSDSATRQAVDDALRRRSVDPTLHATALELAFATQSDLRLSRSHARGWTTGLHELVEGGQLDAAAYALPHLEAAFPQIPYLEYMAFVFRQLPPAVANGREPFVDDRRSDVQIVTTPGADTVVIDFCGAAHQPGLSINLMDRWLARLGAHLVYLRDRQKIGYTGGVAALGRDMALTIESLSRLVADLGARHVVCLGNSAGASGALRYAIPLRAERVLALSPITGGRRYAKMLAPHLPPGAETPWGDLVPLYRDGTGVRARIMYGEDNVGDHQQCARMVGLPGVTVEAVPGWDSHHLVGGLLLAGRFEEVLGWLVSDEDSVERSWLRAPGSHAVST